MFAADERTLGTNKKLIVVDDLPHASDSDQRHRLAILLGRWSPPLSACQPRSKTPKMCSSPHRWGSLVALMITYGSGLLPGATWPACPAL